jgi:hypothetical protein
MLALFSGGGISGVLTHIGVDSTNLVDEHVLVLGFYDDGDPLCIGEDGHTQRRAGYSELILDWRWVPGAAGDDLGRWLTVEEIGAAKGEAEDDPGLSE